MIAMNSQAAYESSQHLLLLAREHGYEVSAAQLARWHRAGLLPRPRQQSLGRCQGSRTLYPPGTGEQLLSLCAARLRRRDFASLAWQLWWAAYPVSLALIRPQLQRAASRLSRVVQLFSTIKAAAQTNEAAMLEISERMLDSIERLSHMRINSTLLRRIRKRVGKDYFPTFLRVLFDIVSGTFEDSAVTYDAAASMTELRILAKGLGFERRFIKDDANITHYIRGLIVPLLEQLSMRICAYEWEQVPQVFDDFELLQARDDVRMLLRGGEYALLDQKQLAHHYPVWGILLLRIFECLDTGDQALFLIIWMALRSWARDSY
ncbi:MAG TPA: hypothetical protein VKV20_12375 [Ktedonobacteraceae bacterium]|jgi:hypothetical protein|nr:hypothetical protein [Ktedonobacteraceae bacterium]